MDLMPPHLRSLLPPIGSSPESPMRETIAYARYRDSSGLWRWYALEFDGADTFFGLIVSRRTAVAGQFTLTELRSISEGRETPCQSVELDPDFTACTVGELAKEETAVLEVLATLSPRELRLTSDLVDLEE